MNETTTRAGAFASRRASNLPRNVFLTMDAAKATARAANLDVIDLSIGSSDLPAPTAALEELSRAALEPGTLGYGLYASSLPFRQAAATWMNTRFGLNVGAHETLALLGSQEGLAHLLWAVCDPGDTVLAPDPAYPSYFGAFALAGVEVHSVPLEERHGFLPDLSSIPTGAARRAKLLLLNYPNNPTAGTASLEFWHAALEFCESHELILVHDAPYTEMTFGEYVAPSALQVPGAMARTVEFHSFSKTHHLAGLRIGWAAGNPDLLGLLAAVKGPVDFNPYLGIQRAAIRALESSPTLVRASANRFEARRDALLTALRSNGWHAPTPNASMYVWAPIPTSSLPTSSQPDSFAFCERLCLETGVALAPGRAFGQNGEGWVPFALVQEPERLEEAVRRIAKFLA
jgi:aspartate/methionine/tyrosine aminotransferase